MNPLHLSLHNCRTFKEFDLELPEGLLAILGSNGAGKSTVINAIDVALFGPESRTLADWYPRGTANDDPLQITLTFEHAGETYRARRTFSPKGRGTSKFDLEREDESGLTPTWVPLTLEAQKATRDLVEDLIGLSRETFRASSFLAQGDAGAFCEAQPRNRKAILADVIGLDDWDRWLEQARLESKLAKSELDKIAGAVERAEQELQEKPQIQTERAETVLEREAAQADLDATLAALTMAREAATEAQAGAERRANAEKAVQDATQLFSDLEVAIGARVEEIKIIDVRLADREVLVTFAEALPGIAEEQERHRVALSQWQERERVEIDLAGEMAESEKARAQASELQAQAKFVLTSIGVETCDRCGQTLHEEAAKRASQSFHFDAEKQRQRMDEHDKKAKMLSAALVELPVEKPDDKRTAELNRLFLEAQGANARLAALDEALKHRHEADRELHEMRVGLQKRERTLASAHTALEALGPHDPDLVPKLNVEVIKHENAEKIARHTIDGFNVAIARRDEQLERLEKIAADVQAVRVRRDELFTEQDLLAQMEKACGPNGVPALILETVAIPQVEAEASRILGLLGGPAYACELRTLREKKDGGLSDTLDVMLLTETGEAPYESFSGGERARIAFALRLALAQLLASRKGSATGLLVIDELEGLDAQGIAALVQVLEELQRSIPRIVVVSHVAELRDSFENTLLLEQVDGVSRVVDDLPLEVLA